MTRSKCPELVEGQNYLYALRIYADDMNEILCPHLKLGETAVYILLCHDGSFYIGSSGILRQRLFRHTSGTGGRYTAIYKPKKPVYCEIYPNKQRALQRERQLKGWSREKKLRLIKRQGSSVG